MPLFGKIFKLIALAMVSGSALIGSSSYAGARAWRGKCGAYNFALSYGQNTDGAWTMATLSINGKPYGGSVLNSEAVTTAFRSDNKQVYYYASSREHSLTFKGGQYKCVNSF